MALEDVLNWGELNEITPKSLEELTGVSSLKIKESRKHLVLKKGKKSLYHLKRAWEGVYYEALGMELTGTISPDLMTEEYWTGVCRDETYGNKVGNYLEKERYKGGDWHFILTKHIKGKKIDLRSKRLNQSYSFCIGRLFTLHEFIGLTDSGKRHFIATSRNHIKRIDFGSAFYCPGHSSLPYDIHYKTGNSNDFRRGRTLEKEKIRRALTTEPKVAAILGELEKTGFKTGDNWCRDYSGEGSLLEALKECWQDKDFLQSE